MAKYKMDHEDIFFTLNDVLNISRHEKYGFDENGVKEIIIEIDKFIENEVYPTRQESDEEGVSMTDEGVKVPPCLHGPTRGFYEMGWWGLGLPEDRGGTPVPEALSAACRSFGSGANTAWSMYPGLSKAALTVLLAVGDDYIKDTFTAKMITGEWGGTMCLTEASAGSDVGNLNSTAKPISGKAGWYKIKGTKIFISGGESDLYKNNIHLVLARTPEGKPGSKGISLFVVPRFKVNEDGSLGESNDVNCPSFEHKMGIHASATCVLNFGENDNCEGYLIGNEFEGMQNMFIMMNEARLDCGIQGESQANLALMLTEQYVKERVQFQQEIAKHPDVHKTMLKMRAMARALRGLTLYTADIIELHHNDKTYEGILGLLTPVCKSFCSDQGFNVCVDAVQLHGGYGYCTEYGIEQFVRDTKIASIYEGTNAIQAIDFIMRKILKDQGKAYGKLVGMIKADIASLPSELQLQQEQMDSAMKSLEKTMSFLADKAQKKEMNIVLQSAKDFLDLNSHVLAAWRLLVAASVAQKKLESGDQKYLESKISDFKVYCSQYLPQVQAYAGAILDQEQDLSQFEI